MKQQQLRNGSFSQDARGRWYINLVIQFKDEAILCTGTTDIGIDLGLKDFATFSDPAQKPVEAQRLYRGAERKLVTAQRANKKRQVKTLHAQIANRRKDALHKLSTQVVKDYAAIYVGNVNAAKLAKTKMAKSVLDAGWSTFRTMLSYKSDRAGVWFSEVNEAFSTVTCSVCAAHSGPKGLEGLRIREWTCSECGSHHDRDVNAARNILRRGRATLAEGIPVL
ncbi:MAG: transposase [Herbaspirillum sp.]